MNYINRALTATGNAGRYVKDFVIDNAFSMAMAGLSFLPLGETSCNSYQQRVDPRQQITAEASQKQSVIEPPTQLPSSVIKIPGEHVIITELEGGRVSFSNLRYMDCDDITATEIFDEKGESVERIFEADGTVNRGWKRKRELSFYDPNGNKVEETTEIDKNGDGTVSWRSHEFYDTSGKFLCTTYSAYSFIVYANGTITRVEERDEMYYRYDANGNEIEKIWESSGRNRHFIVRYSHIRNENGNYVRQKVEQDNDADGVFDHTLWYTPDKDRNMVECDSFGNIIDDNENHSIKKE